MVLAVIPARGGSKGIPGKNLKRIKGVSLVGRAIVEAHASGIFEDIVVTTDCARIAAEASKFGFPPPFKRPKSLAGDLSLATETVFHALKKMEKIKKKTYSYIFMVQPTSPGRSPQDFQTCLKILKNKSATGVISLKPYYGYHPYKMKIVEKKLVKNIIPWPKENPPRQSLPTVYLPDGALYGFTRKTLLKKSFSGKRCYPYFSRRCIPNIDEWRDLKESEKSFAY